MFMYNEWSLQDFYLGTNDPALENDMNRLEELIMEFKKAVAALSQTDVRTSLRKTIEIEEINIHNYINFACLPPIPCRRLSKKHLYGACINA